MFSNLTIKVRVALIALGIFIIGGFLMGLFSYKSQSDQLRETLKMEVKSDLALFPSQVADDAEGLSRALVGLTRMENLLKPFAEKNRAVLLAHAKPIFDNFKTEHGITHMYFIEPGGKVFLRVHKPEQVGDQLTRATYKKAAETKKLAWGIEMGKNFFSLRAVQPVFYQGKPIGYLELGEEIDHLFTKVKILTGEDLSLFLSEEFIKNKAAEIKNEKVGSFTLLDSTNKATVLKLAEKVDMKKGLEELTVVDVGFMGSKYLVGLAPLKDAFGDTAGVLLFQKNMNPVYTSIWKNIIINVLILCAVLGISGLILFISVRQSLALFEKLMVAAKQITRGDLDIQIEANTGDEVGLLAKTFQEMVRGLRSMIMEIKTGGEQISSSSAEIAATSEQAAKNNEASAAAVEETTASMHQMSANIQNVNKNTQSQAASVSTTSASVEQMSAAIQRIAATAQQLMELSMQTKKAVNLGMQAVNNSVKGTDEISNAMVASTETIAALGTKAEEIGKIVDVIDDIAEQTNLLALNAAIEAARAGERGLGFAVVAEEVRKLAERSAKSTKEITDLIAGVQKEAKEAVKLMDRSVHTVEKGQELSRQVGESLRGIEGNVGEVDRYAKEIGSATREQSSGSAQITRAVENLSEMTQEIMSATEEQAIAAEMIVKTMEKLREMIHQNAMGTEALASSSEELRSQAERFKNLVDRFSLDGRAGESIWSSEIVD